MITDNVLIGFETMHWIRQRIGCKMGYVALKLDMSKAYDRVELNFLKGMMLRLGFDNGWVEVVMRRVSSISYSFILNGQVQGALTPNRGIRQGDPLSPYLFVICAHGFSELLIDFERKKLLKGVKIVTSCPFITHLFFADDNLIFCMAKQAECFHLRHCLNLYEKAFGQSINFDKSALSFSPNTGEMDREEICAVFGVAQVEGYDMYLGVPTFSMRNKRLQFGYIHDGVFKKL
ncbi:hypothetical protein UlMin_019211 [Ulmus minor]